MSGGGNKVVKGRMGSSIMSDVNPDQLEAMEKTLEKETKAAEVQTNYQLAVLNSFTPRSSKV